MSDPNIVAVDLSVIVAVYNEDPRNLVKLLDRLQVCIGPTGMSHEVVFVNDGSRAPTSSALRELALEFPNVKLIELSRNFGQQAAITAGLDHCAGRVVVNMDSDLQDPPELIPTMIDKWKEGYDVVYATRSKRRDRFLKRNTAFLFYRILGAVSTVEIPWDTGDFRLLDRTVVEALASVPEKSRFIRGLIPWLGFKQCGVPLDREAREIGESAYTVRKLLSLALDGLLAFSVAPLLFLPALGGIMAALGAIAFVVAFVLAGFKLDNSVLLCGVAFFTGLQIAATGCVSVYLAKVLDETRRRPTYIVARRLGLGFEQQAGGSGPGTTSEASLAPELSRTV